MTAANWVNLVLIPPAALVILLWFLSLACQRYLCAWILSYTGQGLSLIAAVALLACGDWQDSVGAAFTAGAFVMFRWLFSADGFRVKA